MADESSRPVPEPSARRRPGRDLVSRVDLNMTPLIDVVFQLMIFFMLTLKIVVPEGDFDIRMPLGKAAGAADQRQIPPLRVRITAAPDGTWSRLLINGEPLESFAGLRQKVFDLVGPNTGPGSMADEAEVELDCDYGLDYAHVIEAITAVSGMVRDGQVVELVKKVKFTSPQPAAEASARDNVGGGVE
jgi:biopolymer transport protein ExbD